MSSERRSQRKRVNRSNEGTKGRRFDGHREATRARGLIHENEHVLNRCVLVFVDQSSRTYRPAAPADPSNRCSVAPFLLLIRCLSCLRSLGYESRRTSAGSIRDARYAGSQPASAPTIASVIDAPTSVT